MHPTQKRNKENQAYHGALTENCEQIPVYSDPQDRKSVV
jgi:hypothetical protein